MGKAQFKENGTQYCASWEDGPPIFRTLPRKSAVSLTVTQTFFFGVTNMATRNLILISGGPGIFDGKDPALHDTSWSNFIDCPLLLSKNALLVPSSDEQVWWFVFKKAYEDRWADDLKRPGGKNAVQNIKNKKMSSYVDLISSRAKEKSGV